MSGGLHAGHRARMRERYIKDNGLDSFAEHEALELLLFYCIPQKDTNELAHKMLKEFGNLANLFDAHPIDIVKRCNVTENTSILISMMPRLAQRYFQSKWEKNVRLMTPQQAGQYLIDMYGSRNHGSILHSVPGRAEKAEQRRAGRRRHRRGSAGLYTQYCADRFAA